jgi:hypothetical protein
MKKISTLLASFVLSIGLFAATAKPKSTLTIQSVDRTAIKVVIDGRRFEPNDNIMRIQGLETGSHQVKIYRQKNNGLFSILGSRYEVIFNSAVSVQPRSNVMINIDRFGRANVSDNRQGGWNNRNWDRNDDIDFDRGNRSGDYSNDRGNRSGDYSNDRGGRYGDNDNNYGYNNVMTSQEFQQVLRSIDREWLESNKMKSASHIVASNNLTSAQVKQMVMLFGIESNKLDLAKQAYKNTVDKRNYDIVSDAFNFNSSKDELARFIRNIR